MPASDLRETTMNKKSRSLIKVALNNAGKTSEAVSQLMGKNAESRYIFIKQKAEFAKDLDV
jgi:DNA gyrase/topoisomerase IV subunit B